MYQSGAEAELTAIRFYTPTSDLEQHKHRLIAFFREHPPATLNEAAEKIQELTGLKRSPSAVGRFLKSLGMRPRKVGAMPSKADPDKQENFFINELEPRIEEAKQGKRALFFVDAAHFVLAPFLGVLWSFVRLFVKAPAGRQRFNVLGALNAITHELVLVTNDTYINAESVCELLRKIALMNIQVPITLVLDNARYQKCNLVAALALQPARLRCSQYPVTYRYCGDSLGACVTMFGDILQKFVEKSPVTVMVRGLLERLLDADALDRWFEATAQAQYTRDILFSSLVGLMLQVVCRTQASVHAAYRHAQIAASIVSVYAKLRGVELTTSQGLVRHIGREAQTLIETMNGGRPAQLPGYRLKYLDGNCLAASEHRLKALRTTAAGALPGKSLVVFDPQMGLAVDVFPCADGHAQERSLLGAVADTVEPGEVWVADRNFCVSGFLHAINQRQAFFIIRQHGGLATKPLEPMRRVGTSETGAVYEQAVQLRTGEGTWWTLRRITVTLKSKTRNGDTALVILTNLPTAVADAMTIAACYRARWGIETAFQKLERHLNSEIETLGYPQAALFAFCLALVAFNLYAVVMAALRAAHPTQAIDDTVSEYYMAAEIATTMTGLGIAVPEQEWAALAQASPQRFATWLLDLASQVNLRKLRKTTRGPKKPPTPRTRFKGQPHVSTAKLLAESRRSAA